MRYTPPENLKGKELIKHLVKNKHEIIKLKKSCPIKSDPILYGIQEKDEKYLSISKSEANKADGMPVYGEPFERSAIGNLCGWMDSYDDVSLKGSFNRTVSNNSGMMYFMKDHSYSVDGIIAKLKKVEVIDMSLSSLGLGVQGEREAIVFTGEFDEKLDEKAYYAYFHDMAKQHSISLQYVKIALCVNDPDMDEEYKNWERYKSQVINIEKAEKLGYFWGIEEQKVFENSFVLRGANPQTPVLPVKATPEEPAFGTSYQTDSAKRLNNRKRFLRI